RGEDEREGGDRARGRLDPPGRPDRDRRDRGRGGGHSRRRLAVRVGARGASPRAPTRRTARSQSSDWAGRSAVRSGAAGASRAERTYATMTATLTSGTSARPSATRRTVVRTIAVSGRPSMTVVRAPIPIPTPAIIGKPGR